MPRTAIYLLAAGLVLACGGGEAPPADSDLALLPPDSAAQVVSPEELQQASPPPAPPPAATPQPTSPPRTPAPSPAPAPAPAPAPPPPAPAPLPLVASVGTEFAMTSTSEIHSRRNKAGETFTATVSEAVADGSGRVVIPAGSVVTITIVDIQPAENRDAPGTLVLRPTSVAVNGESYDLRGDVADLQYTLEGRGVTAGDAAKVGAGAVVGAIAGRIIGRRTSGAVVGGAVGAAAGTAIAIQTADRDVVVPAGSRIVIRLTEPFSRPAA